MMSYSVARTHLHIPDEGFQIGETPILPSSGQKRHHLWLKKAGCELHVTYKQKNTLKENNGLRDFLKTELRIKFIILQKLPQVSRMFLSFH